MDDLWQDIRYALRRLAGAPGFAVITILVLALGIGANTAIFSLVDAVMLRSLPYDESDRLVAIFESHPEEGRAGTSGLTLRDLIEGNRTLERLAAWQYRSYTLTGDQEPESLTALQVTPGFFRVLRMEPLIGRPFRDEEAEPGRNHSVVLSHGLWQRRFGGDQAIVGQPIVLDDVPYEVAGVMPPGFRFPDDDDVAFWMPLVTDLASPAASRFNRQLSVIGRIAPEATLEDVRTDLATLGQAIAAEHPESHTDWGLEAATIREIVTADNRDLLILLGAVGFVLLIACANVANLLLARAADREREIALRTALGAGRGRLVRQLLVESLVLAGAGAAIAVFVAFWAVDGILAFYPETLPTWNAIGIDLRVLAFTAVIALLAGVVAGVIPALQTTKPDLNQTLKEGSLTSTGGTRSIRTRSALVVAEIALAVVLLIGAGLLISSFLRLQRVDPGFNTERLLVTQLDLSETRYSSPESRTVFFEQLLDELGSQPGISSAAIASALPMDPLGIDFDVPVRREADPAPPPGQGVQADFRLASPDYFRTMGIPLLRGRTFTRGDRADTEPVVIVGETLATRFFSGEDPIGQRLIIGSQQPLSLTIIGVVGEVRQRGLDSLPRLEMYLPITQRSFGWMTLVVQTEREPRSAVETVKSAVHAIDPQQPLSTAFTSTVKEIVSDSVATQRFNMALLATLAVIALVLAASGIYGIMSYTVSQRTQEIGIRISLGARAQDVLRMVVGQGMRLVLFGVGVGVLGALVATRVLASLLYEIGTTDPLTFALVAFTLAGVALVSCYLPARRAARLDPVNSLRYE